MVVYSLSRLIVEVMRLCGDEVMWLCGYEGMVVYSLNCLIV
jgi:hypothetical protein